MTDQFDDIIEGYKTLNSQAPRPPHAKVDRPRRQKNEQFVMVPLIWMEQLASVTHVSMYRLALHLLYQHWKTGDGPIKLSNVSLAKVGVSRREKWRALAELESLGLIRVERRPRRSPLVTVLVARRTGKS